MKSREFIKEGNTNSLQDDVAAALPATYTIPALQNQDPYKQYRFGVAIAKAKGKKASDNEPAFAASSPWGENQVVVSYSNTVEEFIDDALEEIGLSPRDKRLISTPKSEETKTVNKMSPVCRPKRNQYGV